MSSGEAMTRSRRSLIAVAGVLALALGATGLLGVSADAKKKKNRTFEETKVVNAGIPDDPGLTTSTPLTSQIKVPKKFKGKVVGDVNVTGIQTTGNVDGAAGDLTASLTAPNGRTVRLFTTFIDGASFGPWTLDDDSPVIICNAPPPPPTTCTFPDQSLYLPFAGTSSTQYTGNAGTGNLTSFNGAKMRGTWTFTIVDIGSTGETSVLNQWGLRIKAAKPVSE